MKMYSIYVVSSVLAVTCGAVKAQTSVMDTLRACGVSAETLAVSGCLSADAGRIVGYLQSHVVVRNDFEAVQTSLADAMTNKKLVLDRLATDDTGESFDQLQADVAAAETLIVQSRAAYDAAVSSLIAEMEALLSSTQQDALASTLRDEVGMLPPEYRVLDWDGRKLRKLAYALRLEDASQHPLVIEAESVYEVQLARQNLLSHRDQILAILSGS